MLTKEELDQINRFSKAELTADQVYTFSVRLCDNEEHEAMVGTLKSLAAALNVPVSKLFTQKV